jgi:hypothetical protein
MKKFIAIILGLFLALGFLGCNSDGSDIKIDLDEFISNPTALTITGDTLSWDEVDDANGYIVYADGEEVDKVKTNSFDFSSLTGDVIIFQVRTRAPRGMQDSALSAKLAFVANRDQEIANINLALSGSEMGAMLGNDFSEELVNKGMLSSDVESMVDEFTDFITAYDDAESFEDFVEAIRGVIEEVDNIEALVSALVKTQLVSYLEMLVEELEDENDEYEEDLESSYSYYSDDELQEMIDANNLQIDTYEDLIDQIEEDADSIVLAITSTIEYFVSVEEMISDDLVSLVDGLSGVEEASDLNVNELVDIKEEIVSILRETMPTEESMVLVLEVIDLVSSLSGTSMNFDSTVENHKGKMAAKSLYTLEAFINFLDTFDKDFFEDFKAFAVNEELSEEMISAEIGILVVKYFDKFYDDNENLLDTLSEVFTDEEQEALFDEYKVAINEMGDEFEAIYGMVDTLNFEQLMNLQVIFEDSFGALLDAFVDSDGEVVRQVAILSSFSDDDNTNLATGEVYNNYTELIEARELAIYDLYSEAFGILNAVVQSLDDDDINEVTNFLLESIFMSLVTQIDILVGAVDEELGFSEAELLAAKEVISTSLDITSSDVLAFLQAVLGYIVEEDVFQEYKTVLQDSYDYFAEEYGTDYASEYNSELYLDEFESNASLIFLASFYDDFMTNRNRGTLDDILEVLFDAMSEDDLIAFTEMDVDDIAAMETTMVSILDLLSSEFGDISKFDYNDLNSTNLEDINTFKGALGILALQLYLDESFE